jgi:mycothiol synthase
VVVKPSGRLPLARVALFSLRVGLLSNLLGFKDGREREPDPAEFDVRPAERHELERALALVLAPAGSSPGSVASSPAVHEFLTMAAERGVDLAALHVAVHGGRIVSAALPVFSPGRTMLILAPAAPAGKVAEAGARALVGPVCALARRRDVQLAQALIDPTDDVMDRVFAAEQFARMAELHYLHVAVPADLAPPAAPVGASLITYEARTHDLFGRAIVGSYQGSLDCPALNGLRDVEDIVDGHKASGVFDPAMWFALVDDRGEPLGALLLAASPRGDSVELVYLGLLPAARGRKLGEYLVRHALATTADRGIGRLCLAVDSRNTPALKLYYRHGMARMGSKVALLRELGK